MPTLNLGREPIAIITIVIVALGAVNTQISGLTPTVHNVISAALVVLGAVVARQAVTPAVSAAVAVEPQGIHHDVEPQPGVDG